MRPRRRIILAIAIVAASFDFLGFKGIKSVVSNGGDSVMRDVRVVVTGGMYRLGDILPGETRGAYVKSSGDSSLTIQYADSSATMHSVNIDCYFEKGFAGHIAAHVANGKILRTNIDVHPSLFIIW